ncbi:MAG: NAD(+)/NADH kinase [Caldilineae bacterium]|nr:MAG: NAD(+)/NADH kinase [Caldilineae bacterium]
MRVGILHHPKIPDSLTLAREIGDWLRARKVGVWSGSSWEPERIQRQLPNLDVLVALGGDGTLLRTARVAASYEVPILGINLGRLGFLAEVSVDEWEMRLAQMLRRDYRIESRLMLMVETWRDSQMIEQRYEALNDVVVSRGSLARVVRISTEVDSAYVTTYVADGLIVSTATGSTAYALAAGGPILPPELRNILLLPIAPHLSLARPLVLDRGAVVTMHVRTDHAAILTVDGQFLIDLQDGDRVVVTSSPHLARFIRFHEPSHFYRTLMERLQWSA